MTAGASTAAPPARDADRPDDGAGHIWTVSAGDDMMAVVTPAGPIRPPVTAEGREAARQALSIN